MVHLRALPATPHAASSVSEIADTAAAEAALLRRAGFDAVMIENMHDAPYALPPHGPEIVAAMTAAALAVRDAAGSLPIGVQVLARGEREALAIALASNCQFIRCENFVYSHVADEGLMIEAAAGPLLRYRRAIGAQHVAIICDIKKKHAAHAITGDLSIADAASGAEFFGADGLIVTGAATGKPASIEDLQDVRQATDLPLLVGSGVTPEQAAQFAPHADGFIVGSSLKRKGIWSEPLDPDRCRRMVDAVKQIRKTAKSRRPKR